MNVRLVPFAQQRVMPWANGGGSTREVAIDPADGSLASGFRWRISRAHVGCDGPFSSLPGIDRSLWLVSGAGMRLRAEGGDVVLKRPLQRFDFAGETAIVAQLLAGPCSDLNMMTRRGVVRANAEVRHEALGDVVVARGETTVLLVLEGELGEASSAFRLVAGDAVVLVGPGRWQGVGAPATTLVARFAAAT